MLDLLERQVSMAVAAQCCGVPPARLRRMMKAAGKPVGPLVRFGDALDACDGIQRDEEAEHRRMARLKSER